MTDAAGGAGDGDGAGDGAGEAAVSGVARSSVDGTVASPLVAAYRHDVHKLRGRSHEAAADEYAGVPVNETVPLGADRDAALLSRPRGAPEPTVDAHTSPYRLSLVTGAVAVDAARVGAAEADEREALIASCDAERLHARWVTSEVAGAYNETVAYPYTSLQFHTLLVAALLDNYRAGYGFDELYLAVSTPESSTAAGADAAAALESGTVEPHRTVLWTPAIALHVTATPAGRPAARLGARPARSFADVWSRLPNHPLGVDEGREWRLLDAQLRRIRAWSTALAYLDEVVTCTPAGQPRAAVGGGGLS